MIPTSFNPDRNLVITGWIGPTQIIVARQIAEQLKLRFVDTEQVLEARAQMPSGDFKGLYGEARLRALESEVVTDLALYRGAVMHVGGAVLASGMHLTQLQETSLILCLVASVNTVLTRLHIALGARYHNPTERAVALGMLKRAWAVRGRAGVIELDTSTFSESQIVEAVVSYWKAQQIEFTRA
jgi:shikimate kinase